MRGPPQRGQGGTLDSSGIPSGLGHSGTMPCLKQYRRHCSGAAATRVWNTCASPLDGEGREEREESEETLRSGS